VTIVTVHDHVVVAVDGSIRCVTNDGVDRFQATANRL